MHKLAKSETLGRLVRQDDPHELGMPTWDLVRNAIQAGNTNEALALMDYESRTFKSVQDSIVAFNDDLLTHIGASDEDAVYWFLRRRYLARQSQLLSLRPGAWELLQYSTELHRIHGGNLKVHEEPDRYVVTLDPCGTGGQLRRTRDVATTKRAYPWSWGKKGIPYLCTHCSVAWEILPIEILGYPQRIHLVTEKASDPCIHLFYKEPKLIPEEYFERIGLTRTIK